MKPEEQANFPCNYPRRFGSLAVCWSDRCRTGTGWWNRSRRCSRYPLVNPRLCRVSAAAKASSGVEGTIALSPVPVIGTANAVRLSALVGLLTVSVAVTGNGHSVGGAPAADGGG